MVKLEFCPAWEIFKIIQIISNCGIHAAQRLVCSTNFGLSLKDPFPNLRLTTETPELLWGRFFIGDDLGWVTQKEAEESAEELCALINITVNIEHEFEHR